MPELPEVETVRIGLNKLLPGLTVAKVTFDWPKDFPNTKADVNKFLVGAKIIGVRRRAKVLMIDLSTKYSLVIHLKMTGQLVFVRNPTKQGLGNGGWQMRKTAKTSATNYQSQNPKLEERFGAGHHTKSLVGKLPDKSTRVIIEFESGKEDGLEPNTRKTRSAEQTVQEVQSASTAESDKVVGQERWRSWGLRPQAGHRDPLLFFNDQRKFGWMRLMPTAEIPNIDFMQKVGPEPLEQNFKVNDFVKRLQKRQNSNIKAALLDQTVIAGVGNIYADESLFAAGIHPASTVKAIPKVKLELLYKELRRILKLSIKKGGTTDKNYVDVLGKKGNFMELIKVFRHQNQLCLICQNEIIKIRVAGRGTHVCPKCQKLYKVKK